MCKLVAGAKRCQARYYSGDMAVCRLSCNPYVVTMTYYDLSSRANALKVHHGIDLSVAVDQHGEIMRKFYD